MNLDLEKTKIFCRLVYSGENVPNQKNSFHFEHHPNSKYKLNSLYVPIEHFKNMPLLAEVYEQLDPSKLFLQFKILTISKNIGKNGQPNGSYLYFTFPVNLEKNSERWSVPIEELVAPNTIRMQVKNQNYDKDMFFEKSQILAFDGVVSISANMQVANGEKVIIYATGGFDIKPSAQINEGILLQRGYPFEIENQPPANFNFVDSFCNNNEHYKAQYFKERTKPVETSYKTNPTLIYPNPNSGIFYINFNVPLNKTTEIVLFDLAGKKVYSQLLKPYGSTSYTIQPNAINKGFYYLHILSEEKQKTHKVLIL